MVELAGEVGGAGAGVPVVLIHAFPLDGRMWGPQREALSAGRRVLVPDLRGFGNSPLPAGPHSIEDHAEDVSRFLTENSVGKAVLCGLSMGGYVALAFAALFPERAAGLVLADTRAAADTPAAKEARTVNARRVLSEGPEFLADDMLPKMFTRMTLENDGELPRRVRGWMAGQRGEGVAAALEAMRDRPSRLEELPRITCPVLVVVGSEDAVTTPAESRAMAGRIPGALYEEIPGAAHLSNLEKPVAFNQLLHDFFRKIL